MSIASKKHEICSLFGPRPWPFSSCPSDTRNHLAFGQKKTVTVAVTVAESVTEAETVAVAVAVTVAETETVCRGRVRDRGRGRDRVWIVHIMQILLYFVGARRAVPVIESCFRDCAGP